MGGGSALVHRKRTGRLRFRNGFVRISAVGAVNGGVFGGRLLGLGTRPPLPTHSPPPPPSGPFEGFQVPPSWPDGRRCRRTLPSTATAQPSGQSECESRMRKCSGRVGTWALHRWATAVEAAHVPTCGWGYAAMFCAVCLYGHCMTSPSQGCPQ